MTKKKEDDFTTAKNIRALIGRTPELTANENAAWAAATCRLGLAIVAFQNDRLLRKVNRIVFWRMVPRL